MSRKITEGAAFTGESGRTYLAVFPLGQENVWTAVDETDPSNIVVLKSPSADDTRRGWPRFQHEMIMHELFKTSGWIRKQVDRIPASTDSQSPPILVLEIAETTLWEARSKRPFTKDEIQAVARAILHGLREVHAKGLVYADLKMQNIMISGFDVNHPGDGSGLVIKLGDLGIVMAPSMGKVQPVAYRAPEVQLKYFITEAADVWGFALIYCHLLEAQTRFSKTGLYDDLNPGHDTVPQREQAVKVAITNDYDLHDVEYYQNCELPWNDPSHEAGEHWDELKKRGLNGEEIEFLKWVLKADPTQRPTASAILRSKWFGGDGGRAMSGPLHGPDKPPLIGDNADMALPGKTDSTSGDDGIAAQAKKRKHDDQPLVRSARDFVASSAAPFLPWLATPESTTSDSVQANPASSLTPLPRSSPEEKALADPQSPRVDEAVSESAAPFLPWFHGSSENKENTPDPTVDVPVDTFDHKAHGTHVSLKDHPLVATALKNQNEHDNARSEVPPSTGNQTNEAPATASPTYLGQQSSTGGTYLSYRPG